MGRFLCQKKYFNGECCKMSLEQTKGQFQLVGIVKGIDDYENAVKEGTTRSDKPYKRLQFMVQTSEENIVPVEMFGMVRDEVIFYNMKEREKKKVSWENRAKSHKPFALMGINMGLEKDSKGNKVKKTLVEYDAIDYIAENLSDGDSVFVKGDIDFQEYENQEGKKVNAVKYVIRNVSKVKESVNFEAEDFKEKAMFEQEVVIWDTEKIDNKLMVYAKNIKYNGEHTDAEFVVDAEVDGGKFKKLASNMSKRLKTGDFIKLYGKVINRVELEEEEVTEEEPDDWGGDSEVEEEMNKNYIRNYIRELLVTSVDSTSYESSKYNEDDFLNEDEDNFGDDFGEDIEEGEDVDEDEDDLPFG